MAILVRSSSDVKALGKGMSSEWNQRAPGKIQARKAGLIVETIAGYLTTHFYKKNKHLLGSKCKNRSL